MPSNSGLVHLGAAPTSDILTVPDGWMENLLTSKQAASTRPVVVANIGGSVSAGINATNVMLNSWWAAFRHKMAGTYGLHGDFINPAYNATTMNGQANSPNTNSFNTGQSPPNSIAKVPGSFSDAAPWVITPGTSTLVGTTTLPNSTASFAGAITGSATTVQELSYTSANPYPIPPGTPLSFSSGQNGGAESVTVLRSTPPGLGGTNGTVSGVFTASRTAGTAATGKWPALTQPAAGGLYLVPTLTAGTATLTFTCPYATTCLDILYDDMIQGTWTVNVDSGVAGQTYNYTLSSTGATVTGQATNSAVTITNNPLYGGNLQAIQIRSMSQNIAHTVTITVNGSIDYLCRIAGIMCYNSSTGSPPSTGMAFAWCSVGGHGAHPFLWNPRPAWRWGKNTMIASPRNLGYTGIPCGPDLAFLELGGNDGIKGPLTPQQVWQSLFRVCSSLQRGNQNVSMVMMHTGGPDSFASDNPQATNTGTFQIVNGAPQAPWSQVEHSTEYEKAMSDIAEYFSVAEVNVVRKWQENPITGTFSPVAGPMNNVLNPPTYTGDPHPTNAGHNDVLNAILEIA